MGRGGGVRGFEIGDDVGSLLCFALLLRVVDTYGVVQASDFKVRDSYSLFSYNVLLTPITVFYYSKKYV